jgi:hypothetical protein
MKWQPALLATFSLAASIFAFQEPGSFLLPELGDRSVRDVAKVDAKHYHVEFENDQVRTLRAKLGADETVPMHDSRSATIIAITEIHLRFTRPDKKIVDVHLDAGGTRWIYDDSFSVTNLVPRKAEFLFIEPKTPNAKG